MVYDSAKTKTPICDVVTHFLTEKFIRHLNNKQLLGYFCNVSKTDLNHARIILGPKIAKGISE